MMRLPVLADADRAKWARLADGLAAATLASVPWSTSATSILIVLWLIVLVPTLSIANVRREVMTLAGGLPVLFWMLGALGMLWADVSFREQLAGLSGFHKLLLIPLLLAQFRQSENLRWAICAFFASVTALLALSGLCLVFPVLQIDKSLQPGVPLKDYISQATWFQFCIFALLGRILDRPSDRRRVAVYGLLAVAFLIDIAYVASSRTAFVAMPLLLLLLGARRFGWKGLVGACVVGTVLFGTIWMSSSYLRQRMEGIVAEIHTDRTAVDQSSAGQRIEFWTKSMRFIEKAPVFGNGTGSIKALFRGAADGQTGAAGLAADNPHQQTFAVGIQLGFVGMLTLWAMWAAHLWLFRGGGEAAWLGLVIVTQNVIASLFNSHLFDFTQGWFYVIGVGVLGGAVLRKKPAGTGPSAGSPVP